MVDGEMQANFALNPRLLSDNFPFCEFAGEGPTLIFPSLEAGNIAYKLLQEMGAAEAIGPVLLGMKNRFTFFNSKQCSGNCKHGDHCSCRCTVEKKRQINFNISKKETDYFFFCLQSDIQFRKSHK